jgi:pantothenate synthetase
MADIKFVSAGLHGTGNADEVLVSLEVNGEPRAPLLRDVPDLARSYRGLRREERASAKALDDKLALASKTQREAIEAADRAHRQAVDAANDAFEKARDEIVDERKAAQETRAAARKKIDDEAFELAVEQVRREEQNAAGDDDLDEDD